MRTPIRYHLGVAALLAVALAACNGGSSIPVGSTAGSSGAVTTQDAPAPGQVPISANAVPDGVQPNGLSPIVTEPGDVYGATDKFTPHYGDASHGGRGQVVDGVTCTPHMVTNLYHVHVYLGIVHNGRQIALPYAIGMVGSAPPENGYVNIAKCYYHIHTHDSSGIVHLEVDKNLPLTDELYRLKNVLDIWGIPRSTSQFGPFKGPIHVFVGNVPQIGQTVVSQYAEYKGSMDDIRLKSHEVIWIEIGD
ncbi:MAG TPA: hypothetical protein VMF61_08870, partial [Candidatus Acidoferrales bacterium]|nr:hypothetical protein [Candidatus Acidoferrales bacterium]